MTENDKVNKYKLQSLRYIENAKKSLANGDFDKASELLWGSAAQAVKTLAATKGLELKYHRDLWDFMSELSQELNEPELYKYFLSAHHLHSNFYEVELDASAVLTAANDVLLLVNRLFEFLGQEN